MTDIVHKRQNERSDIEYMVQTWFASLLLDRIQMAFMTVHWTGQTNVKHENYVLRYTFELPRMK